MAEKAVEEAVLSAGSQKIIEAIGKLSVLELAELVKALEEKFGVSAQVLAAPGAAALPAPAGAGAGPVEEKTLFDVILTSAGEQKIQVIKEVRAATTLGLKEAKDLVEAAPKPIKEKVSKEEAAELKKKLEAVGAKVEVR